MLHVCVKILTFFYSVPKDRRRTYVRRHKNTKKSCSKNTKTIYLNMVMMSGSKALGVHFLFCLLESELKKHKVYCKLSKLSLSCSCLCIWIYSIIILHMPDLWYLTWSRFGFMMHCEKNCHVVFCCAIGETLSFYCRASNNAQTNLCCSILPDLSCLVCIGI